MTATTETKPETPAELKIQVAAVVVAACQLFDVKASAIQSYDQVPKLSRIRGLIIYIARTHLRETFAVISAHMNRDTSTVQNAFRGVLSRGVSSEMRQDIEDILEVALELQAGPRDETEWGEIEVPRGGQLRFKADELRPSHAIGEAASPEWFQSCEAAYRSAMIAALWQAKAERDAARVAA